MPDPLPALARSVEGDPFFLAALLAAFAASEALDEAGLAAHLGCPPDALPRLKLCRAPRGDPAGLREDSDRLAGHFGLDPAPLREAVLRGRVILELRRPAGARLLAARDRDGGPP